MLRIARSIVSIPKSSVQLQNTIKRAYTPREIQWRSDKTGYFQDPNEIARRLIKLVSLHDSVQSANEVTLNSTWHDIGVGELDFVEILFEAEKEFYMEFPDDEVEKMNTIGDVVEFISRSFYSK